MKIIIEEPRESEEEQIIFRCREMTPELLQIIARLKAQEGLVANLGTQIHRIRPSDIYYIEVVENKTTVKRQCMSQNRSFTSWRNPW